MNELYLQDYILKHISRKYNHKSHKNHPSDELTITFGRVSKGLFHKEIPQPENLLKILITEGYIFSDGSISPFVDEFQSSEELNLPNQYLKYADLIFGTLKSLYFATEVNPVIFEKTCVNLKSLSKDNYLITKEIHPLIRPDVINKGNVSGVCIKYEYGESFRSLNEYFILGKHNLENLTKNDFDNLLTVIKEIEENTAVLNTKKIKIPHSINHGFKGSSDNHENLRIDCLTFLKKHNAIVDFKIIEPVDSLSSERIEVETRFLGLQSFVGKMFNTKIGQSLSYKAPPIKKSSSKNLTNKISSEVIYEISYTMGNEILLNKKTLISRPQFDSENDAVFKYLIENPNKPFTRKQISNATERTIGKSFHKTVENIGFKGELRRLFFQVSENSIMLRNPIYQTTIDALKIDISQLPQ